MEAASPSTQASSTQTADAPIVQSEEDEKTGLSTLPPISTPKNPTSYGRWVLLPALIAILLAVLTRQVVPALVVAVFVGAYMMVPCLPADHAYANLGSIVAGFRLASENYILGAIVDSSDGYGHAKIVMFTLLIGFMVGVMGRNGGTAGMVKVVVGKTESPRRGALTAWLAGLVVFFDDYANTMIVGPTMRSVFDRLKISRAKLAYIVDSTAAPVASIALVGTWVGAEIGFIQQGLNIVADQGEPLLDAQSNVLSGMGVFLNSIAYRFYPILALVLVFLVSITGRDFGPMRRSQQKSASRIDPDSTPPETQNGDGAPTSGKWWLGMVPIAVLVLSTVGVLIVSGLRAEDTVRMMQETGPGGLSAWAQLPWWEKASLIVGNADSYLSIFYGAVLAALTVTILTMSARVCSTRDAVDAGLDGMSRMFPAIVILILAWSLSAVLQTLKLGDVAGDQLRAMDFPVQWLPLVVFICAALISFATGTSWGTLGILCPITVTIAADLIGTLDPAQGLNLLYASVGSVLAGAVFGDHCSPISDTTVLSSIAAGCPHEEHVWTQLPYAVITAIAAMGLGDVLCSVYQQPWYYGMAAGAALLVLVVFVVGRPATPNLELAHK